MHDLGRLSLREHDRRRSRHLERRLDHHRRRKRVVRDGSTHRAEAQGTGERHRLARGQHVHRALDDEPERHKFSLQGGRYYAEAAESRAAAALATTPSSVTYAVTSSPGVTSKARFSTSTPAGARRRPPTTATSSAPRRSIGISEPSGQSGAKVESGAAT